MTVLLTSEFDDYLIVKKANCYLRYVVYDPLYIYIQH